MNTFELILFLAGYGLFLVGVVTLVYKGEIKCGNGSSSEVSSVSSLQESSPSNGS